MYEELVKRLRYAASYDERIVIQDCKEAADAIAELTRENENLAKSVNEASEILRRRWIPVTERLPEKYVNVLCHLRSLDRKSEYYSIDHLMEDGQWWKAANSWKHEVTHWMPLPEPPKEEI